MEITIRIFWVMDWIISTAMAALCEGDNENIFYYTSVWILVLAT